MHHTTGGFLHPNYASSVLSILQDPKESESHNLALNCTNCFIQVSWYFFLTRKEQDSEAADYIPNMKEQTEA